MTIALSVLAGILLLIGFVGCVVPVLPGPIIAYCGLLTFILTEKCPPTLTLVTMGLVVAAVTVVGVLFGEGDVWAGVDRKNSLPPCAFSENRLLFTQQLRMLRSK